MWELFCRSHASGAQRWYCWYARAGVWLLSVCLGAQCVYGQPPASQPRKTPAPKAVPAAPPAAPVAPKAAIAAPPVEPGLTGERVLALSLEEAIRLALQNNLDITRERYSPQIARTEVEKGRASFDPTVGVTTEYSQTQALPSTRTLQFDRDGNVIGERVISQFTERAEITPTWSHKVLIGGNYELRFVNTRDHQIPSVFGSSIRIVDPRFESRIELAFTQPLLRDFGIAVNTATIRQAEKAELIAEQQVLQAILDTVFTVQQSYWELVFRIQDLEVKRESQKLAEDFLAENTVRVELGTLAPIELVQARTQVKTREGDVILAESAVGQADDLLKEVLNIPETLGSWQIRIRPIDSPPFVPVTAIPVQNKVTLALDKRPDFQRSQLDIATREIARDFAQNQRLPRLDLTGRSSVSAFGDSIDKSIGDIPDKDGYEWAFGLQLQYPLGNRFARNEVLKRDLELQQALVDQRKLIRTIVREVRQAVRDIETASKRVEVTRQATELARIQLDAEQEKFRLGLSTSFNVLEFQEDLSIARSDETRALSDYNVALARLDQLTGRLQYDDFATGNK